MDIQSLKQQSDLSFETTTAKKNALERAYSRQLIAYNDHLFRANTETINLVHTLSQCYDRFFISLSF